MKSQVRTIIFAVIIFSILWYISSPVDALDLVKRPEIVVALAVLFLVILFNGFLTKSLDEIKFNKLTEDEKESYLKKQNSWYDNLLKKLTKTKPIEKEHEIILDHNYDGIRELDNNLPPWWLYGFYASIIFAVFYMFKYHVFNGDNQYVELETEYAEARKSIEEYKKTAKNLVDYNTVEILTEASDLKNGKAIFEANCVVCHKSDGGGGIGPNLADKNWILGGSINDIFKTISEGGRDGKGMIAWKQSLKPIEMAQVSSYVLEFQGTTPAEPKAPEGEIWNEESEQ